MKKKQFSVVPFLVLLLGMSLAFQSCKKESNEDLLTSHAWKFKSMTTSSSNETVQGLIEFAAALLTNATIEYMSDGTYLLTTGLGNDDGTWSLQDDETLIMDGGTEDESVNVIKELTSKSLVFVETIYNETYQETYTVTTSWTN